ncbi:efflux RND transporter permease subunit [Bdellovibrio sp. HCB2-146]|uniref:efflux RND transporter permease subunit n=1 Tax=Bdellovibrio sp. HCB2-146 TaxID=3394362 RepID=UPI0039BD3BF6
MFSKFFIERPVFATVLSIVIIIAGYASIMALPIEQYPPIVPPQVSVTTKYPGASAEVISETVAAPLEQKINGVENMIYMQSYNSSNGDMILTATFAIGTDPDLNTINVNNRVQAAIATLPEEVRRQGVTVQKKSSAILQIITLTSPDGRYDQTFISNYALINVLDDIKRIPGVGDASIIGARDYSIRIWQRPDRMAQLGVTSSDIISAIREQNSQFAAGKVGAEPVSSPVDFTMTVTTQGRLEDPKQFADIIVRSNPDGSKLRLSDVARIDLGSLDYNIETKWNGKTAIGLAVYLAPGANQIQTATAVIERMEELKGKFPTGITYSIPYDTTTFVKVSITEVLHTLLEAMILVFIVVYLFLQNWRATLIPCLAVPVSIVGTFAGMYALGFSINTLTLFGLVLAIGLVVDDAIVVLENVERIMHEKNLPPKEATIAAMEEVSSPVIAIVFVLCAVFIPVAFAGGLAGQMYKQFAITIAISVAISGLVALTLTPALCAIMLKPKHGEPFIFFRWFNTFFDKMTNGYSSGVGLFIRRGILGAAILVATGIATVILFGKVPGSLVPDEDQGYVFATPVLQDGASLSRTRAVGDRVDAFAMTHPDVRDTVTFSGFDLLTGTAKTNMVTSFIVLKDWKERKGDEHSSKHLVAQLLGLNAVIPEAKVIAYNPPPITGMSSTGGIEFYIQNKGGESLKKMGEITNQFLEKLNKDPMIAAAQTTYSANIPQVYARLDRERSKAYGVPINSVFDTMSATFGAYYVNDFNKFGRTFKVELQSEPDFRAYPGDISNVYVRSNGGAMLPLTSIMDVQKITGPELVERLNVFPATRIIANPQAGVSSGQVIKLIEDLAKKELPSTYDVSFTGPAYQEKQTGGTSMMVFIYGMIFVFLILAAQYEKWSLPVSVLLSVPYAMLGAILANFLRGLSNDVYFQVALVTLIGLSAKNAILIVEFAVEEKESGKSLREAAMSAAKLRFRPIIMTSLAFVFGALPLAIASGAGSASRHSLGTGIIGGMLASTFMAVFFIPMFYVWVISVTERKKATQLPPAQVKPLHGGAT